MHQRKRRLALDSSHIQSRPKGHHQKEGNETGDLLPHGAPRNAPDERKRRLKLPIEHFIHLPEWLISALQPMGVLLQSSFHNIVSRHTSIQHVTETYHPLTATATQLLQQQTLVEAGVAGTQMAHWWQTSLARTQPALIASAME